MAVVISIVINTAINFEISILVLLYGLTNSNFTVPLLNSSLIETPATITTTITIIAIYVPIEFWKV